MSTPKRLFVRNKKTRKQNIQSFILSKFRHQKFTYKANIPFHKNKTGPCILKIQRPVYKYQKLYSKPQYVFIIYLQLLFKIYIKKGGEIFTPLILLPLNDNLMNLKQFNSNVLSLWSTISFIDFKFNDLTFF